MSSNDTLNQEENKISPGGVFEKEDIVLFNALFMDLFPNIDIVDSVNVTLTE